MDFKLNFGNVANPVRQWLVAQVARAINGVSSAQDRAAIVEWLANARGALASSRSTPEKIREINAMVDHSAVAKSVIGGVSATLRNYRASNLPLSVKIALPATIAAAPFLAGQGVGIAAFGSAVGAPALLLMFIGSAGIASILEAVAKSPADRDQILQMVDMILRAEMARRYNEQTRMAMRNEPRAPRRADVPDDADGLRRALYTMDPFVFEGHVVHFFGRAGLKAWNTKPTGDHGADGFAVRGEDMFVIQCKRYAPDNKVGAPTVREFKGVIEENEATRGYIVTTSTFTTDARASAAMSRKLVLVDIETLIGWHRTPPNFAI
ncbi:restriction endonuclease [Rhodoblastus acidophilus]|nr:restriction endonuclease [Rhodoblastus acidophilus]PPQ35409.1 restriction endonuclease [Rhodoblastus acidophilus]RAI17034.1 restriction endonuclease [Rhodoblastus acidophilus]